MTIDVMMRLDVPRYEGIASASIVSDASTRLAHVNACDIGNLVVLSAPGCSQESFFFSHFS